MSRAFAAGSVLPYVCHESPRMQVLRNSAHAPAFEKRLREASVYARAMAMAPTRLKLTGDCRGRLVFLGCQNGALGAS
jgi:hypothetical protein